MVNVREQTHACGGYREVKSLFLANSHLLPYTWEADYEPLRPQGQFQVQFPACSQAAGLRPWAQTCNIKANGARHELLCV